MTNTSTNTVSAVPEHVPFDSITRWNRKTIVTEKIHGCNMAIHVLEDGSVHAQSRKKIINTSCDVNGFARWVQENSEELAKQLGIGVHFGEWAGKGVQKGHHYGLDGKAFWLFNIHRWESEFNQATLNGTDPAECGELDTTCLQAPLCRVVPVIAVGNSPYDPVVMGSVGKLQEYGSYAAQQAHAGEGVVIFHTPSQSLFKILIEQDHLPKGLIGG